MTSQVFYRKWRPQALAEVAGQEHVTTTLANALSSGRVAHAYLFCGPRGTGKTSTGRILAKAVNCEKNGKGEPCNACVMCQSFNEGRALDLIEIDAASNRGIEEIRALKEKVNFAPSSARRKVYIIDEVHMLTEPAFNALLKTLEEPPAHSIFILATTEVHKIPATILSRCQRFDFRRIPLSAVVGRLRYICEKEGIEAGDDALSLVARTSTGSLRDAENLLEQIVTSHGMAISLAHVRDVLGISGDARVRKLAQQVIERDLPGGLVSINSASEDGLDLNQFNRELIDYLRGVLLSKSGAGTTLDITSEVLAEMKALAAKASLPVIVQAIKLFGQANFRSDSYSTLPLELALADCVLAGSPVEPRAVESRVSEAKAVEARVEPVVRPEPARPRETVPPVAHVQPQPVSKPVSSPVARPTVLHEPPTVARPAAPVASGSGGEQLHPISPSADVAMLNAELKKRLREPPEHIRRTPAVALLRSSCRIAGIEQDNVVLEFKHKIHKEKVEEAINRRVTEEILSAMLGSPHHVRCVLAAEHGSEVQERSENYLVKEAINKWGGRIVAEEKMP